MNQPILHVDMTPDADLPARVLRAYRANCDVQFEKLLADKSATAQQMNMAQRARAALFDRALATLERGDKVRTGMAAAKENGRRLGRPGTLEQYRRRVAYLMSRPARGDKGRQLNGAEIARRMSLPQSSVYKIINAIRNGTPL